MDNHAIDTRRTADLTIRGAEFHCTDIGWTTGGDRSRLHCFNGRPGCGAPQPMPPCKGRSDFGAHLRPVRPLMRRTIPPLDAGREAVWAGTDPGSGGGTYLPRKSETFLPRSAMPWGRTSAPTAEEGRIGVRDGRRASTALGGTNWRSRVGATNQGVVGSNPAGRATRFYFTISGLRRSGLKPFFFSATSVREIRVNCSSLLAAALRSVHVIRRLSSAS